MRGSVTHRHRLLTVPAPHPRPQAVGRPTLGQATPSWAFRRHTGSQGVETVSRHSLPLNFSGLLQKSLLSPHFASVTGETFNKSGKTDILIRHEGANVFVAECKFWHGVKAYLATIDQILSYLTWRDSKAAIICFVQNLKLNPVLEQIDSITRSHPCFVKHRGTIKAGWFQFDFHMQNDPSRQVFLAVLCFHLPAAH